MSLEPGRIRTEEYFELCEELNKNTGVKIQLAYCPKNWCTMIDRSLEEANMFPFRWTPRK